MSRGFATPLKWMVTYEKMDFHSLFTIFRPSLGHWVQRLSESNVLSSPVQLYSFNLGAIAEGDSGKQQWDFTFRELSAI